VRWADIKKDGVYYHAQNWAWNHGSDDPDEPDHRCKATVLDEQRYSRSESWRPALADHRGNLVRVRIGEGAMAYNDIIPITRLRGPYEKVAAERRAALKARRERESSRRTTRETNKARREELLGRAQAYDITAHGVFADANDRIWVSLGTFERLLDAYAEHLDR